MRASSSASESRPTFIGTAEVGVQRRARGARVEVPDRRVEDAERAHHRARAAVQQRVGVHLLPETFDAQRLLTDQLGREELLDRDLRDSTAGASDVAEGDALLTRIRANLHEAVVARADRSRGERRYDVERHADNADGYGF